MRRPMCRNCCGCCAGRRIASSNCKRRCGDLEQTGRIARIKGNRYIQSREADLDSRAAFALIAQGKGFCIPTMRS